MTVEYKHFYFIGYVLYAFVGKYVMVCGSEDSFVVAIIVGLGIKLSAQTDMARQRVRLPTKPSCTSKMDHPRLSFSMCVSERGRWSGVGGLCFLGRHEHTSISSRIMHR